MDIQPFLERSTARHSHLCPRQVLGVRIGLLAARLFNLSPGENPKKRLLTIVESDGCFSDGVEVATGCTLGHRTLRVEDYGKTAAVFVDTVTGQAVRVSPALDLREKASVHASGETRHYFAQMQAYQVMLDAEMFTVTTVFLKTSITAILSRPGVRLNCEVCGEEIMNEREVKQDGQTLCRACAGAAFYQISVPVMLTVSV